MGSKELHKSTYMALIMVVVSALALSIATYAWFVNNTKVGVETMDFSATVSTSLVIATHQEGATVANQGNLVYKNLLSSSDIEPYLEDLKRANDGKLSPVSTVSTAAFFTVGERQPGTQQVSSVKSTESKEGYYLALPVWLKASEPLDVYLSTTSAVTITPISEKPASKYLDRALRIAFTMVDDSNKIQGTPIIFEPNDDKTVDSVFERKNTTIWDATEDSGVASATSPPALQDQVKYNKEKLYITNPQISSVPSHKDTPDITVGKKKVVTLGATPQKVIFYIWIEGMDYDCVAGITGGTLGIKLNFIGVKN